MIPRAAPLLLSLLTAACGAGGPAAREAAAPAPRRYSALVRIDREGLPPAPVGPGFVVDAAGVLEVDDGAPRALVDAREGWFRPEDVGREGELPVVAPLLSRVRRVADAPLSLSVAADTPGRTVAIVLSTALAAGARDVRLVVQGAGAGAALPVVVAAAHDGGAIAEVTRDAVEVRGPADEGPACRTPPASDPLYQDELDLCLTALRERAPGPLRIRIAPDAPFESVAWLVLLAGPDPPPAVLIDGAEDAVGEELY